MEAIGQAAYLFATTRAGIANYCAKLTALIMVMGSAQHEVGSHLANFRAIHHQSEMRRLHVAAADFERMADRRLQAKIMTALASLDTFAHFRRHRMVHGLLLSATKKYATSIPVDWHDGITASFPIAGMVAPVRLTAARKLYRL
jgi:hypothetical protein